MSSHAAPAQTGAPTEGGGAAPLPGDGALAQRASSGMAWLMAQTIGYKLLSLFGTIYLTHLITPEHLGQMTLALSVAAFTNFLQQPGLREVLVQRRARSAQWDSPALSFSIALGLFAAALTMLAGPAAAWLWKSPVVMPLLLILAGAAPFFGLAVVPEAQLQSALRFRELAVVEFLRGTGLLGAQIGVAFALKRAGLTEWGAFALAAPVPVFAALRCAGLWAVARPRVSWRPRPRLWRFLWTDSVKLFLSSMVGLFISQGSLFVLGWRYGDDVVGHYAFAFNLSLITAVMLTQNIGIVIFPVLSTMQNDPARLKRAFLRSGRLLNMIAIPLCLLQGALAEPFIRTACQPRWAASAPIMQMLSVAMAMVVIWPSSKSLMQAQGRYTLALFMHCVHAAVFVSAVLVAATQGEGLAVATAVALVYLFIGIVDPYMALRPLGGGLRDVLGLFAVPAVVGTVGVVGTYLLVRWLLPADREYVPALSRWFTTAYLPQAIGMIALSGAVCAALYRALAPHEFGELLRFARRAAGRALGRRA